MVYPHLKSAQHHFFVSLNLVTMFRPDDDATLKVKIFLFALFRSKGKSLRKFCYLVTLCSIVCTIGSHLVHILMWLARIYAHTINWFTYSAACTIYTFQTFSSEYWKIILHGKYEKKCEKIVWKIRKISGEINASKTQTTSNTLNKSLM